MSTPDETKSWLTYFFLVATPNVVMSIAGMRGTGSNVGDMLDFTTSFVYSHDYVKAIHSLHLRFPPLVI
jgi:hypothetical protein